MIRSRFNLKSAKLGSALRNRVPPISVPSLVFSVPLFPRFDVITLTLLHPVKSSPVQSWAFESDTVIRIGRANDNQVVLYSAVVSRHHVELRYTEPARTISGGWELVSLGANGTYIDAQRVIRSPITDGMVFRLARSGPNVQVLIQADGTRDRTLERLLNRAEDRTQNMIQDRTEINEVQTPQVEAIAIASERYSQLIMEQGRPSVNRTSLLFDTLTGHPLNVIKTIGGYPIIQELGQGSMASTYLCWRNGQTFALKQLNAEWSQNNEAIARFKAQIQQLKAIIHPGVPQVVDEFREGTQPVFVMEMVYGQTLADEVTTQGPLSQPEAIAIALEVCDILTELHDQPMATMVHGDIHPQHLIRRQVLRSGQEIVLIDFGLMRHYGWNVGLLPSSVGYTAPELQDAFITPAIDYYALGTTLAYLLTGEDPALFYGYQEEGYRFQVEFMTGISPEMTTLIQHLTHPNPSDRPTSVREIEQALRTVI